jgi:formylglycine-generating enzyme required for sulfatase activity
VDHEISENPKGPIQGIERVTRGGAWDDLDFELTCARRGYEYDPCVRDANIGFRLVRSEHAGMVHIPGGTFEMGDHHGLGKPDELPVHAVSLDPFHMDVFEVTTLKYCDFLNSAYSQGWIEVINGSVMQKNAIECYCATQLSVSYSRVMWDGSNFTVVPDKAEHPMIYVSWHGAAAYANWRSMQEGRMPCYDLATWACDFEAYGYRLPTEAEWEYAARGGEHNPYYIYPWGDAMDGSKANYAGSGDPYENPPPATTPVGYYNGFQTPAGVDMANGYGLYDMSGNVYEWCNDWYDSTYYSYSPIDNPKGPAAGSRRLLRGGSWCAIDTLRCAFRDAIYPNGRSPIDGFRLVLSGP